MSIPISADSHIVEAPEVFAGLADRFGDDAPRIATTPKEGDGMVIPSDRGAALGAGRLGIAGRRLDAGRQLERRVGRKPRPEDPKDPEVRAWIREGYAGLRKGIVDAALRPADQDTDGVRAEVLYPSFFFRIFSLANTALVEAAFRNYNDWIADYQSQAPERLVALALLPLHDPAAGARELERVLALGFRGACIPCTAPRERPYRDAAYEPIWARAEEARLPLSMHIGTGASSGSWESLVNNAISGYASAPQAAQETVSELICQGVAHRHPELLFVVTEFNAGWIPTWLERLDQGYERQPTAAADCLDRRPSEYWSRQFFATFEDDRAAVLTRELVGVDRLLWGNDYPHRDSTWPVSRELLDELFEGVSAENRAAMTHGNAAALYGL
jgi:predicted TIM-barrel fold metal-dependent hydrolase